MREEVDHTCRPFDMLAPGCIRSRMGPLGLVVLGRRKIGWRTGDVVGQRRLVDDGSRATVTTWLAKLHGLTMGVGGSSTL